MQISENARLYWRENLKLLGVCLFIWALVSYGAGIVFADALNNFQIGHVKLGFWFAQQGSLYTFLLLILFYARRMNKIERKFNVQER